MSSRHRRILFALITLVILLILVEVGCLIVFTTLRERLPFHDLEGYRLEPEVLDRLVRGEPPAPGKPGFHPELGWDMGYKTSLGQRPGSPEGPPLAAAFGDSLTHCDDVDDQETWEYYLAELLDGRVDNFGTSGFGTDQALLKYRSLADRLDAPVVILGLITENANRVVNRYRPFYYAKTGVPLTKPRFRLAGGQLELLPNPVRSREELRRLGDPAFLARIGRDDWWFQRQDRPVLAFPYSARLLDRRLWREVLHQWRGEHEGGLSPRPWTRPWRSEEPPAVLMAVLSAFARDVRQTGAEPLVLVMPIKRQLQRYVSQGKGTPQVQRILRHCRQEEIPSFDALTALGDLVSSPDELPVLYANDWHLSAAGNRALAGLLVPRIREILPREQP